MTDPMVSSNFKVLVVEDDNLVRALICSYLESAGYQVFQACTGEEMFVQLDVHMVDILILDLGLPDEDGIVLIRKMRARSNIPIIVLTARNSQDDCNVALDVGADDYLSKSVDPKEFLLRVRNLLNRTSNQRYPGTFVRKGTSGLAEFDGWQLDAEGYELRSPEGNTISMTPMEIKLLTISVQNTGRVLSRDRLLDSISGITDSPSERMIDAFVSRIRKKIESDSKKPTKIVTVTGVGYKFVG